MENTQQKSDRSAPPMLELRLHGRGGQGGVTGAKILAAVYAGMGKSVQTFGDYAGERSGAPVRAYTRVSDEPITNRNKVYRPDHLLVLDPTLLGDDVVSGLAPGGVLLLNTSEPMSAFEGRFTQFRLALVDATAIARKNRIGTRSVVIVNTTIAGAFLRAFDLPLELLEQAYLKLGLSSNLGAAKEAYDSVQFREATAGEVQTESAGKPAAVEVPPLVEHVVSPPTPLKTGNWRTQTPHYVENLAPCSAWCPAGNDVIGFVRAVGTGGEDEASRILGRTTPLAGVCGRVCAAPCMEGCNRREHDGAVNIRGLERWISDKHPVAETKIEASDEPRRFAIVGGGPAGLAAAYTLVRRGHDVTIYDLEEKLGGVLHTGIPTYRLPRNVLEAEVDAVLKLGVKTKLGVAVDAAMMKQLASDYDAVIVATGLQRLRGLDGTEGLGGVEQGIHFLHRVNVKEEREISGHVVVLGGGNTAMDCARSALRAGASKVTVAYRRSRAEMPAIDEEIEQAEEEGIEMLFLRQPVGFAGNGRVQKITLAEVELGEPDDSGRRRPIVTDKTAEFACDAVLLALGQSAEMAILPENWNLEEGRLSNDGTPLNVFAAGDVATGDGTVTHAIGDGRRAATRALRLLGVEVEEFARPDRSRSVPVTDLRLDHFAPAPATRERHLPVEERVRHWEEVSSGMPNGLETHRCFSCGHCTECDTCLVYCPEGIIRREAPGYGVDYTYCKGCGICVTECPRKAIEMRAS